MGIGLKAKLQALGFPKERLQVVLVAAWSLRAFVVIGIGIVFVGLLNMTNSWAIAAVVVGICFAGISCFIIWKIEREISRTGMSVGSTNSPAPNNVDISKPEE